MSTIIIIIIVIIIIIITDIRYYHYDVSWLRASERAAGPASARATMVTETSTKTIHVHI